MRPEDLPIITLEHVQWVEDGVLKTMVKKTVDAGSITSQIVPIDDTATVDFWLKQIKDLEDLRKKLQEQTEEQ